MYTNTSNMYVLRDKLMLVYDRHAI